MRFDHGRKSKNKNTESLVKYIPLFTVISTFQTSTVMFLINKIAHQFSSQHIKKKKITL